MTLTTASVRYRFGRFELQPAERRLLNEGVAVRLGPHAFDLLFALVERAGHLTSKDELLSIVWGKVVVEENTLQVHVASLRKVLGHDAIATVSGQGYRFVPEVERLSDGLQSHQKTNLPNLLTSFVGREQQVAEIRELLADARLCTLTGAGGCGKTRLALQVAAEIRGSYADGVWLVELASLSDPSLLLQVVQTSLGIKGPAVELNNLTEWLKQRNLLLLLDNAEHLIEPCALLADTLLRCCGGLSVLVTSRERLGVAGEQTYRVPSLSVPGPEAEAALSGDALTCEAGRLFIERARLVKSDFSVSRHDEIRLAAICRRVDGIALAIELAAPLVRHMSIQELNERLADRFTLLTGGSRTALPRHRTLRALVDWSYDLLQSAEKVLLQRVSVFAGGWSLAAAEQVCAGGGIEGVQVKDLLTSLTDKSLVIADIQSAGTRFGMLETIRQYAHERLIESGEASLLKERHVQWLTRLADHLNSVSDDEAQRAMRDTLNDEHDNIRSALAWTESVAGGRAAGLDLATRLYRFWTTRAPTEGRTWIERMLMSSVGDSEPGEQHAKASHVVGTLALDQGDIAAAERHHRAALNTWRRLNNRQEMLRSIGSLGGVALNKADFSRAESLFEEALSLAQELGDRRRIAVGWLSLAHLYLHSGNLMKARTLAERSVSTGREVGQHAAAQGLETLGRVRQLQGDLIGARECLTEAAGTFREFGDVVTFARSLTWLAGVSLEDGKIEAARDQIGEALAVVSIKDQVFISDLLEVVAAMITAHRPLDAARCFGAAERFGSLSVLPPDSELRCRYERRIAHARAVTNDDAAFDLARSEGSAWSSDQAVRFASAQVANENS